MRTYVGTKGGRTAVRSGRVRLNEEALGQAGRELRPHRLYAVHDLLLVADQRDAQRGQVGHGQLGHVLQPDDAGLLEVVQVPGHLDRAQPLVHRPELRHVRRVRAQRVRGPAGKRTRTRLILNGRSEWVTATGSGILKGYSLRQRFPTFYERHPKVLNLTFRDPWARKKQFSMTIILSV